MPRLSLALVAVVSAVPSTAPAAEMHVAGEGQTIQGAIDVARDGDVIVVAPGVYGEAIDFLGKRITVRSEAGPFETTIDASGHGVCAVVIDTTGNHGDGGDPGPRLEGFRITGAAGGAFGGGVRVVGPGAPVIEACIIQNNAANFGGGLYFDDGSNARIRNTILFGNTATGFGTAIFSNQSHPVFTNCTLTANSGHGGVLFSVASQVVVTNSIIWNNTPSDIMGVNPEVRFSAVEGGWPGAANIDQDPLFRDPALGDYRPGMLSPCLDAGNDADVPQGIEVDIRHNARFVGAGGNSPRVDMGAIEYQGVEPGDQLPPIVEIAPPGMTIIVQPGVYEGPIDFGGKALVIRSTGGPEVTTIVPPGGGEQDGEGGPLVLCTSGEGVNSILDGFTIAGGTAPRGGGMLVDGAQPLVVNCIFRDNFATAGQGGAIAILDGSPEIVNCVFLGNHAFFPGDGGSSGGGAIYNEGSAPRITNCTFIDNFTDGDGGAIRSDFASAPFIANCVAWFNTFDAISGPVGLVSFSNIEGGFPGPGNIDAHPRIVNEYELGVFSPCIDAGDTTAFPSNLNRDVLGQPRFFDDVAVEDTGKGFPPIDMGASEFQGAPPPPPCDEDVDGNGDVGFSDVLAALLAFGPCDACVADVDGDGEVAFSDILRILTSWGPCPQALGACCTVEGCLEIDEGTCFQFEGEFLGPGTSCARDGGSFCGFGACCIFDGTCVDGVTADDCFSMKGDYRGDGSSCVEETCGQ